MSDDEQSSTLPKSPSVSCKLRRPPPDWRCPIGLAAEHARAAEGESKNDRPLVGCIGTGDRWNGLHKGILPHGDIVAVCDVDRKHAESGKEKSGGKADIYDDYRKLLDRKDIDVVTIVTPDHWHTKIAIDAMKAGKDVYCEKPLTLTIDEGKQICKVLKETGRVFQVGTQQRSEMNQRFLTAVALVRDGRIGKVQKVTCAIGGAPDRRPVPESMPVPPELNWDMWLGQAPLVDYTQEALPLRIPLVVRILRRQDDRLGRPPRRHRQWAIGMDNTGPALGRGHRPSIPNVAQRLQHGHRVPRHLQVRQRRRTGHPRTTPRTASRSKATRARSSSAAARSPASRSTS